MQLNQQLAVYLQKTGKPFSVHFIPESDEWCVTVGSASTSHARLEDAMRCVWSDIDDYDQVVNHNH
ncbi:hypothetical protein [Beggiatoa leptomitoformis]|uniref:Uncharacterized protein n=1 Tax=Beggiatoa leptomitoformis TaxID=288004 RepID=A0A2N9YD60_9GAMM|nr:hypothetical protein [Beggiatoa leptomitoformis]ALG69195.1 hypothetical protein AL038_17760 [Beggiatoa leptomitoformis]AUI68376.1 hypothetical protein BLE401_06470 [Beggiatoa leptomitoformis]